MHLFNKILTITMLAFLLFFLFLLVIMPDRTFSEMENRPLQKRPSFSWEGLFTGKFNFAAENYLCDQFAFRDLWVSFKSAAELVLQKKDHNGVYFGRDGYLLPRPEKVQEAFLAENIAAINCLAQTLSAPVYFLLAPASVQVLDDKLPLFAGTQQEIELLASIEEQFVPDVHLIEAHEALVAHKQEYLYYKTDHHWTSRGAYYAYREAAQMLGFKALEINDFTIEQASDTFYGTLYSKSGHRFVLPDTIEFFKPKKGLFCLVEYVHEKKISNSLYEREHLQRKDKYAVFLDGNHALIKITTHNQTGRRLLVIKDSFANSLLPFLANHYDEIQVIDLRHFNTPLRDYIAANNFNPAGEILFVYNAISFAEDPSLRKILLD